MWNRMFSLEQRRRRLLAQTPPGPLHDYLSVHFPSTTSDCHQLHYLALDLETTGLDPERDEIISCGWVCLAGMNIDLTSARHRLVRPARAIPEQSAVIHRITDDQAAQGSGLAAVMEELLALLAGKVLIAHHARVELGFLDAACHRLYGGRFLASVVDTQFIAQRWFERRNQPLRPGEMRLGNLRQRYNLPRYRAHDALSDALGAAELFMAQCAACGAAPLPLKDMMLRL